MKRIYIIFLILCGVAVGSFAGMERNKLYIDDTYAGAGNQTNATSFEFSGYLDEIWIDMPLVSTCTVTIATSRETLLTATDITADTLYRPEYLIHDAAGNTTNDTTKACLFLDWITVTVTNNNTNATSDVSVYITTTDPE